MSTITFFENITAPTETTAFAVEGASHLQIDVITNATNFKMEVLAQVVEGGDFLPLAVIGNTNFKIYNSITKSGFYRIDTSGIVNIKFYIEKLSDDLISCKGEWVSEGTIVDVALLPQSDIKEDIFYRVPKGSIVYGDGAELSNYKCIVVDGLPNEGEPITNDFETMAGTVYFNIQDNAGWGYVDAIVAEDLGISEGWYGFDLFCAYSGMLYGGTITSITDDLNSETLYLLIEYFLYNYKEGAWISLLPGNAEGVGQKGEGLYAEVFNSYTKGELGNIASGEYSHAEGFETAAQGNYSHAEGNLTRAVKASTHSEGYNTTAYNNCCHAEGNNTFAGKETMARNQACHAEGRDTVASGDCSHAEGRGTVASGNYTHAEGYATVASGGYGSHAEGYKTIASGEISHAEGEGTYAAGIAQHVHGSYNIIDTDSNYIHIVGNGSGEDTIDEETGEIITQNRSNAHTLDWYGNAWYQGKITIGTDISEADDDYVLVNKKFLNECLSSILAEINTSINASAEDEGKILKVVGGKSTWINVPTVEGVEV